VVKRALLTLALLCVPSLASAQTVVVFPVGGDATLAAAHSAEVLSRVQSSLEDSGMTVLVGDDLARAATDAHAAPCSDPSCAPALLPALHASLGVGVALWSRNGLVQVSVVLTDEHGTLVSADADGAEGVIDQATQGALSQARARWATREGSPVRVVGSPEGASITIDHDPVGSIPYEGHLSPGTHQFVVSADGHRTERRSVEIPASANPIDVRFGLTPGSDEEVRHDDHATREPDDGRPLVIGTGIGVMAAGVGLLVPGIVNVATAAERCVSGCDGDPAMRVVSVPHTDGGFGLAVTGVIVLAIGAVLLIVGASAGAPQRSSVTARPDGFAVRF
jgi:hypothetical protein